MADAMKARRIASTVNDRTRSIERKSLSAVAIFKSSSPRCGARKLSLPGMVIYPHYPLLCPTGYKEDEKEQPATRETILRVCVVREASEAVGREKELCSRDVMMERVP